MDLRYPIGNFDWTAPIVPDDRPKLIDQIAAAPSLLRAAVKGLTDEQLDTPYRPGGWTVRQTIHHMADSHVNCYIRFRLALTEEQPAITPYDENKWALLEDAHTLPVEVSLQFLDSLHQRWTVLLRSLSDGQFLRSYRHPDLGLVSLDSNIALYAWHGRHHAAHITALRDRNAW
jgi:uncharacterized damage-inducible protein DinB